MRDNRRGARAPIEEGKEPIEMSHDENRAQRAEEEADRLFHSGWNCAESAFQAIYRQFREDEPPVHLITALGGGMGCKTTCGAVSGAVVALGVAFGRTRPDEAQKKIACAKAHDLCKAFREEFHSLECWELTADFENEQERKCGCTRFVRTAASLACGLMTQRGV
jgi:C_GCAxxG_C_C family probable redox protein